MPSGVSRERYTQRSKKPILHGRDLADLRTSQGMTISDLAEKADLSIAAISRMERGKSQPRISTVKKIAEALKVDKSQFYRVKGGE